MKNCRFLLPILIALAMAIPVWPATTPNTIGSELGLDRTAAALALHRFNLERSGRALRVLNEPQHGLSRDQGNVSVIEDDGTIVIPLNRFDLATKSLTFTPLNGGYTLQAGSTAFDGGQGTDVAVQLGDDDSVAVTLPFTFTFYGTAYNSLFLNTDGNLTFGSPDPESTDRNLRRVMTGPARMAVLFYDLVPGDGRITTEKLANRVIITWSGISEYLQPSARSTFQIVLWSSGAIQFNYGPASVDSAIIALSPGATSTVALTDLSQQVSPAPVTGLIAEVFSNVEKLDLAGISEKFYETHKDAYDHLVIFSDFDLTLPDAFAYEVPVRNDIQGIIPGPFGGFDFGSDFGSPSRLAAIVNAGSISQYPDDPHQVFLGTNNTLEVLGQEFGHRWLAFVDTTPTSMLGRDRAHWSFFMNTSGSVMEGNEIQDLGGGRFRTVNATYQYSPLDQYIMGLRPASEVQPWFVIANPRLISAPADFVCRPLNAGCPPAIGVEMEGTRRDLNVQNVISIAGPRVPSFENSQKDFAAAFILITRRGQTVNPKSLPHVDNIRQQWEQFFVQAVGGRGTMSTRLQYPPPTITVVQPQRGPTAGGTVITLQGSGFLQDTRVTIGRNVATTSFVSSTSLQVTVPQSNTDGTVSITVINPDGQAATQVDGFTYFNSGITQLVPPPVANGSWSFETAPAPAVRVGYGIIEPAGGVAILKSFSNSSLVSEAAIPATLSGTHWIMYAEKGFSVSTGIAIANPNTAVANLSLTLSDGRQASLQIPSAGQRAAFVDELFTNLDSFFGTLTIESNVPVAALALRGTTNSDGRFIIATIPLSSRIPENGGVTAIPLATDGAGYNTELILVNSGLTTSTGTIVFSFDVNTDAGRLNAFPFSIAPGQAWRLRTSNSSAAVLSGYAVISVTGTSPMPDSTAMIRLSSSTALISETAIPAQRLLSRGLLFGVEDARLRTGLAILNPSPIAAQVTLTPRNSDGNIVASTTLTLSPFQRTSTFLDELLPALRSFEGTVTVESPLPVYAVSLRGTSLDNGGFLMAAVPILDLNQTQPGPAYFPQVVVGGPFQTEFFITNVGTTPGVLRFIGSGGEPLSIVLQ